MKHFNAMPQLQKLSFQYEISDDDLELLKGLPHLQTLDLRNPQTTDEGMKQFEKAMPKCKVNRIDMGT